MITKLTAFKAETDEFAKKKLLGTIDMNMEFHEWMENHKNTTGSSSGMDDELDLHELIALGEEPGIIHPFACQGSPFFNNFSKDQMLEVVHPTPDQRPFANLNELSLVIVNENETKFPN